MTGRGMAEDDLRLPGPGVPGFDEQAVTPAARSTVRLIYMVSWKLGSTLTRPFPAGKPAALPAPGLCPGPSRLSCLQYVAATVPGS